MKPVSATSSALSALPVQSSASIYLAIGESIPSPAPESIQEVRVNTSMYDAAARLDERRAHRHEHRIRHECTFTGRRTCIAEPTG